MRVCGRRGWSLAAAAPAAAETYPARTVTIITPFAAGSQTDAAARLISQHICRKCSGRAFVIENKAGAGRLDRRQTVARAKPDGYTLLLTTNSTHSAIGLFKSVPYDPIKDFAPIARVGNFPSFVAVRTDFAVADDRGVCRQVKANPGKLSYGAGNSTGQIVGETLKKRTGIDRRAGRLPQQSHGDDGSSRRPHPDDGAGHDHRPAAGQGGKIRPLAVLTKERQPLLPDVPTLARDRHAGISRRSPGPEMFGAGRHAARGGEHARECDPKMLARPDAKERFLASGVQMSPGRARRNWPTS